VAVGSYGRDSTGALFTANCTGGSNVSCNELELVQVDGAESFDEVGAALAVSRDLTNFPKTPKPLIL